MLKKYRRTKINPLQKYLTSLRVSKTNPGRRNWMHIQSLIKLPKMHSSLLKFHHPQNRSLLVRTQRSLKELPPHNIVKVKCSQVLPLLQLAQQSKQILHSLLLVQTLRQRIEHLQHWRWARVHVSRCRWINLAVIKSSNRKLRNLEKEIR